MVNSKSPPDPWSHDFRHVLNKELDRFDREDAKRKKATAEGEAPIAGGKAPITEEKPIAEAARPIPKAQDPIARAYTKQLVGLAFSGGGIRSATFNLGVLQALARLKLLGKFDYLSTVSGGGYIGSWLMAWIKRRGVKDVWAQLRPERGRQAGGAEAEEIHFLRRFSNYLTPKLGWLGADMWTVIAVYLRNLILNFMILGSAFAFVLVLPRLVAVGSKAAWNSLSPNAFSLEGFGARVVLHPFAILGFTALAFAVGSIVRSMRYFALAEEKNAAREIIEHLENEAGWRDAKGNEISTPFATSRFVWYAKHLDDFILELRFRFAGAGRGRIVVWAPLKSGAPMPQIDEAQVIHLTAPDQDRPSTATINDQEPVRPAALRPGWNELEITAVDNRCTVRVNEETINTARIKRPTRRRRRLFSRRRPIGGVFAIEANGIDFEKLTLKTIESAFETGATQGQVQRRIIAPLFLAAFLAVFLFGFGDYPADESSATAASGHLSVRHWLGAGRIGTPWPFWACGLVAGILSAALVLIARVSWAIRRKRNALAEAVLILPAVVAIFLAAGIGGFGARALYDAFIGSTAWEVLVWGSPSILAAFLGTTVLLIGLLGRFMPDERREWWSRLSAWLLIYSLVWIGIFGVAFYGPVLLREIARWGRVAFGAISVGWVVSTVSGLIAARSAATTGKEKSNMVTDLLAKVAPYVFIAGFLVLLSWAADLLIVQGSTVAHNPVAPQGLIADQWNVLYGTDCKWLLWFTAGFALIGIGLSLCLDINQFSMHLLYRNRLGRCYLGASNRLRRAQPFTGFSADDDVKLVDLRGLNFCEPFAAPYPIINAALNLVGGKELAWQQRKAASFTFTPDYCGYEFPELPPGYCRTKHFASKPNPVTLATAMAISGAAASPNMGYHTSPAPAFLMTVFNVRLGWWLGNTRKQKGYERSGPLNVLFRLICELFGLTSEEGKYVYLSDGGHFENLGIYELVRRRCRFIVACDAEEDHIFGFGGLGNAIEKCRSDFGVDIDIDVEPIRHRSEKGHSDWHCAIGKIHYSRVDREGRDGILVYLKSSLTGDEPTDVLRYAAANPGFPHQSTGDQWFDESQFESYRVLGFHIAENVFGALGDSIALPTLTKEDLFVELAEAWHPPSAATADAFTKHTQTTVKIYDELRTNEQLAFLHEQIYPEWWVLMDSNQPFDTQKPLRDQLPDSEEELKAGFYLCNSVLQLFEDAYVDLNLENEFDHPDNRGWMNLFKHWSWAGMLRVTWTICASNYGARFQTFCDRHLGLKIGDTRFRRIDFGADVDPAAQDAPYRWSDKIAELSGKIAEAIGSWLAQLSQLSVGSKVIADAALKASEEARGSKLDRDNISDPNALDDAKRWIVAALRSRKGKPIVLRAPQRNDEEWFAAAVLLEMCRRVGVDESIKRKWADTVADLVLSHAAILAERCSTKTFQEETNTVERKLIESFFIFNPSLAASGRILRLEVTPDPNAPEVTPRNRNLHFPFGFAILAKTSLPADKVPRRRLVYFRVQDHLRRMGLARDALAAMIGKVNALEADLRKMHPDAHEVPTDKDRARFMRLFDSVKSTTVQKAAIGAAQTN